MRFTTLNDWLAWQETLHPEEIELGLDRIKRVRDNMRMPDFNCAVISVAGTNGKGSSIAMLQAIYLEAGYRVGTYTSPHLYHYNERICINGEPVSNKQLVESFQVVDDARADSAGQETSLTYFEFGTLAALEIFSRSKLDVILLEVGLGGRLDAVNIVDNDVALLTSIDLDHQAWLGETREDIASEKAGILRSGKVCVISDPSAPLLIDKQARQLGCRCHRVGQSFEYQVQQGQWRWQCGEKKLAGLPFPALSGEQQLQNAAGVIMVIESLQSNLPVSVQAIRSGLLSTSLPGRFEIKPGDVTMILDVAHNPAAAKELARTIRAYAGDSYVYCVFSILADKDIENVVQPLIPYINHWSIVPVASTRGMPVEEMAEIIRRQLRPGKIDLKQEVRVETRPSVREAVDAIRKSASNGDIILVCGSFYIVAEAGQEPV
jgi:dihydrofolate synthase/folylpolyglutamate synthase